MTDVEKGVPKKTVKAKPLILDLLGRVPPSVEFSPDELSLYIREESGIDIPSKTVGNELKLQIGQLNKEDGYYSVVPGAEFIPSTGGYRAHPGKRHRSGPEVSQGTQHASGATRYVSGVDELLESDL